MRFNVTIFALLTAFAAAGCATSPPAPAPEAAAETPAPEAGERVFDLPYESRVLDNGLKVIVVKTDYPDIVSLQIPVKTGSRNEVEPGKSGFAHFFEHMMFRGTENTPPEVYAAALKAAGAEQNAYTTDDYTNYHIDFTKADVETVLALEADRFMNLSYAEDVFRTEALAVKGEYIKNSANPIRKLIEQIRDTHYSTHTYKHTTMGFFEDIEDMPNQYEYSKVFFDRWYRPEKSAVVLVGDLEFGPTFALVEKYFGQWERGDYSAEIPAEPPAAGPNAAYVGLDTATQPWIAVAFRGPAFDAQALDMPAMDLVSQLYFAEGSDLHRKLVLERQIVDQLFPYFPNNEDPGLLYVFARVTDPTAAEEVRDEILRTFAEVRTEPVSPAKLDRVKDRMRYAFLGGLDNTVSIAGALASFVRFDRTPETINQLYRSYEAVTAEDIVRLSDQYFTDARRTIGVVAQGDSLEGLAAGAPSVDGMVSEIREASADFRLVERPSASSPLVDVSFVFRAGASLEPPGKKGLATLTALMITDGGSTERSIDQINEAMYPMAAGFGAQVDKEMVRLSGGVHQDNLEGWYALVTEQLLSPGWRAEDFERVRTQLVNAIMTDLVANNDEELGKEALYQFIYGPEHPYGTLNLGIVEDIQALTLDDVKAFYAAHYVPANLTVGLAGGYPETLAERLRRDLGRLPPGDASLAALPAPPAIDGHEALILEKETMAHAVSFGFPITVKRGDPDWVALWLATQWLGQHRSNNSHLYERIREVRGMNYGDYAYIEYFPRGMFQFQPDPNLYRRQQIFQVWIRPLTGNNEAHFATRVAMYELDKLITRGMSEAEFEATRDFLDKFVAQWVAAQPAILGYAIDSRFYGIPEFADYVRSSLKGLTVEDVNRVIRDQLTTEDVKFVFITPDAADLKARLVGNRPSPMSYNSPKPPEVLAEDQVIQALPMDFTASSVTIVPAESVFRSR
ncbi:MAG: pitrilysin family protein [Gammaproteobacteria bacterium]